MGSVRLHEMEARAKAVWLLVQGPPGRGYWILYACVRGAANRNRGCRGQMASTWRSFERLMTFVWGKMEKGGTPERGNNAEQNAIIPGGVVQCRVAFYKGKIAMLAMAQQRLPSAG